MRTFLLLFSFFGVSIQAAIQDIGQFVQAAPQVTEGTIVVTDLDNTLIETQQTLGSAQWFDNMVADKIKKGMKPAHAVDEALSIWVRVQLKSNVRAVEPAIPSFIRGWQDSGIFVVGLTARPASLREKTREQLKSVGIDLNRRPIFAKDLRLNFKKEDAVYEQGILFAGPSLHKGGVLAEFFQRIGVRPQRVVFIDDLLKNVQSVEASMKKVGIPLAGLRYGGADARVKAFDAELANTQLKYFENILSDEEVRRLAE